ncbi:polysaccharide biosynthesis tyrosine autokinase [Methylosinus sp. PW1]|uniref:GumC family protein n=1 Tax=Methylosinus sp. PW1 TaxID=107636 RepID=UPI00068FB7D6|nr:polysaccharide biosynthesis tyrosine autokinase [Methylosinus sp. PW1]
MRERSTTAFWLDARSRKLRAAAQFLRRRWPPLLGATMLALLAGAAFLAMSTPRYTTSAQLLIEMRPDRSIGADAILARAPINRQTMKSDIAVIRSAALLRRVVERERLADDPEFGAAALDRLRNVLAVAQLRYSPVIKIAVTSTDPAKAARLADAIADAFVVDRLDTRLEAARRASAWLAERLVALQRQSRASEEALAQFRAAAGPATPAKQQTAIAQRAAVARAETAERKARLELLQRIESRGGGAAELPGLDGALDELRQRADQLSRREAELRARYTAAHPSVVALRAEIADVQRAMDAERRRLAAGARQELELAEKSSEAADASLREISESDEDRGKERLVRRNELERAAAADRKLLDETMRRARLVQEQAKFEPRDARIISPALAPSAPSWPDAEQTLLIALALGAIIGLGVAYACELADAGFTTIAQIETTLALPLLGSIPKIASSDPALVDLVRAKPLSRASEALRALRSAIAMSDVDDPPRLIQLASAVPGEGTTTIAAALAASAAQSGLRTLLIDADLRRRAASKLFRAEERPGLVELLIGSASPIAAIFFDETRGLWVLPAGGEMQAPADLLASEKMKTLMAALRGSFDLVILDTPPIGPVVDPTLIAGLVDKTVVVIRWAATARETVAHAIERLPDRGRIAGVALNLVIEAKARKYGPYAYSPYAGGGAFDAYHIE